MFETFSSSSKGLYVEQGSFSLGSLPAPRSSLEEMAGSPAQLATTAAENNPRVKPLAASDRDPADE